MNQETSEIANHEKINKKTKVEPKDSESSLEENEYFEIISNQIRAEIPGAWVSNHKLLDINIEDSIFYWWGTVPVELLLTTRNNSKVVVPYDRKFIVCLINPPKDESSPFMNEDDFFFRWNNNVLNLPNYQKYISFCKHFGFDLICEPSADRLIAQLRSITKQSEKYV